MTGVTFTQNSGALPNPNTKDDVKELKRKGWRDKIVEREDNKIKYPKCINCGDALFPWERENDTCVSCLVNPELGKMIKNSQKHNLTKEKKK